MTKCEYHKQYYIINSFSLTIFVYFPEAQTLEHGSSNGFDFQHNFMHKLIKMYAFKTAYI